MTAGQNLRPAGEALNKTRIQTICKKTNHLETIPGLCFEITAKGEANYVKNFLWEKYLRAFLLPLGVF